MAVKTSAEVFLHQAIGIKNVFVNDWKINFFTDPKKKIASVPFIRNIIEYTKGNKDAVFIKLTSLLHWKGDSAGITQGDLDEIYNTLFGGNEKSPDEKKPMIDIIRNEAALCTKAGTTLPSLQVLIPIKLQSYSRNSGNCSASILKP